MYRIFIVEDEPLELEALELILTRDMKNIKVVGKAGSGLQALSDIRKLRPEIVIMDINIPELNGVEVLRKIKEEMPDTKVILITAYNEFDYAHQAIKARVDDFLLKPIRPVQLVEAVNQIITEIKRNSKDHFDGKLNEVIFSIVQKRYRDTEDSLTTYLNALYERYNNDLIAIQNEIIHFMDELNAVSMDMCDYEIRSTLRGHANHQYFVKSYQNAYDLKVEIMRYVNKIFDKLMDNPSHQKNNIDDIKNYIDRNCRSEISLDLVGEYANMSSYYLSKIFKRETGINFVTYLTERKVEIAKEMLINTDIPIINIALELSYHEPNYFSKVFKKSTGLTPTEYRRVNKRSNFEEERDALNEILGMV